MEVFNGGEAFMRADDHQFFQPMYISSFGPLSGDMPYDEERHRLGLEARRQGRRQGHDRPDDVQDEPAELTAGTVLIDARGAVAAGACPGAAACSSSSSSRP